MFTKKLMGTVLFTGTLLVLLTGVAHSEPTTGVCEITYHNGRYLTSEACENQHDPPVRTHTEKEYISGNVTFYTVEDCIHYNNETECKSYSWSEVE